MEKGLEGGIVAKGKVARERDEGWDDAVNQVVGVSIYTGLDVNREDWPDTPIIREKKADR
jgi:hypothetical protein